MIRKDRFRYAHCYEKAYIRDVTAPIAIIFIMPFIFLAVKSKFRSILMNFTLLILTLYWAWHFFIRIMLR
ncbi:MAG: YjeO family protein [Enterobacteriaceae bacterium]|nr:YjeO family protein [Enterobacteriaceae bacterium]